jgi:ribonuclease P protein component
MELNNKFSKLEKLKSKKSIDLLFKKGKSIRINPIRVVYLPKQEPSNIPANVGVAVPKKNIRLAVNRNLIKRRIREAYRLNNNEFKKHLLNNQIGLDLMFVYNSQHILPYSEIEDKIKVILTRLIKLSEVVSE